MGCDGGSIQDCRDIIVTLKKAPERISVQKMMEMKWTTCNLCKEPLREPIVADELGFLYNKEAVIQALLEKTLNRAQFPHIKTLRDLIPVNLTPNPDSARDETKARFICPVTLHEVGGQQKFVLLRKCGHVITERALKEIQSDSCVVCGTAFSASTDTMLLNPSDEIVEERKTQLKQKAQEKRANSRKPKEVSSTETAASTTASTTTSTPTASTSNALPDTTAATTDSSKKQTKKRSHDDAVLLPTEQRARKHAKADIADGASGSTSAAVVASNAAKTVEAAKKQSAAYNSIFLDKKQKAALYGSNDFLVRSGMKGPLNG